MEQDISIHIINIWVYKQVYVQRCKETDTVCVAIFHNVYRFEGGGVTGSDEAWLHLLPIYTVLVSPAIILLR